MISSNMNVQPHEDKVELQRRPSNRMRDHGRMRKSGLFKSFTRRASDDTATTTTTTSMSSSCLDNGHQVSNPAIDIESIICDGYHEYWDNIPQHSKIDLVVGKHLGKGSFSDVFEVSITKVGEHRENKSITIHESLHTDLDTSAHPHPLTSMSLLEGADEDGEEYDDLDKEIDALFGSSEGKPGALGTSSVASSVCLGHLNRCANKPSPKRPQTTVAMKCLRPQVRSDSEQFIVGIKDLVQETTMLASLDHPNIVQLHGRAGGSLHDGYFILLDCLTDTLDDRINRWKKNQVSSKAPPSLAQIKTAGSIANAIAYLHSKNIVFRDLKPANVGFDSAGVLKLFDFGFATSISLPEDSQDEDSHLLYDKCGTPRYMAPEIYWELGYGLPADVYSFGILLWEICTLKKPFDHVKSAAELQKHVFEGGARPKLSKHCPQGLNDAMTSCWSSSPDDRPCMFTLKTTLSAHVRQASTMSQNQSGDHGRSFRKSFRRFT